VPTSLLGAWTFLAVTLGSVQVEGTSTCPLPADVEARLRIVLPTEEDSRSADRFRISVDGDLIHLELRDAAGAFLGERSLKSSAGCKVRASAVATIIAAWEVELQATLTLPSPAPTLPVPPSTSTLTLDLDAGLLLDVDNDHAFAPGGLVSLFVRRSDGQFGLRVAIQGAGPRDLSLGTGVVQWFRCAAMAGAAYQVLAIPQVSLHLSLAEALEGARGAGYGNDKPYQFNFDPGLEAGVQATWPVGLVRIWLDGSITLWPWAPDVSVAGLPGSKQLPPIEVMLVLGAGWEKV
jgi:hypothetical protein